MKTALLLSGGIDSAAIAWWKRPALCYTIDYGQTSARAEVNAALIVARSVGARHVVLTVPLTDLGAGPLANAKPSKLSKHEEWWPFRNQMLITLASMHAVQENVDRLMIGTIATDGRHKDGSFQFLARINALIKSQEGRLGITAPALRLGAKDLVIRSKIPAGLVLKTHSCHRGNSHCCACPGCEKRLTLFKELDLSS